MGLPCCWSWSHHCPSSELCGDWLSRTSRIYSLAQSSKESLYAHSQSLRGQATPSQNQSVNPYPHPGGFPDILKLFKILGCWIFFHLKTQPLCSGLGQTERRKLWIKLGKIFQPKHFFSKKWRFGDIETFHEFMSISPNCFGWAGGGETLKLFRKKI